MTILESAQTSTPQDPANPEGTAPEQTQQPVEHDWEKRYKDLQSYSDKELNGMRVKLQEATQVFQPPKTDEELKAFGETNPDWMGVIETVAHNIAAKNMQPIQEELNKSKASTAAAELLSAHPDAGTISQSPDFQQWAAEQGPDIQAWLADEHDASKVIRALTFYKAMRSTNQVPVSQPTYNDPSAARAVSTHGSVVTPQTSEQHKRFSRREINAMHPNVYEKNYEAIKYASQNGLLTD